MPFRAARRGVPELLGELVAELQQHGVQVLDARAYPTAGVVRVPGGLTIWCYGHLLRWRQDGAEVIWPAADAYGAARRLAELVARTPSGDDRQWTAVDGSGRL